MCGLRLSRAASARRPSGERRADRRSNERAFTKFAPEALLRKCAKGARRTLIASIARSLPLRTVPTPGRESQKRSCPFP